MSVVVIVETVRRHFASVAFVAYLIVVAFIAFMTAWFNTGPIAWRGFTSLLIVVAGAQLIGPEFSSGTLQLILARPINRSTYLLSRYAGVISAIWIFLLLALSTDLIARAIRGHTLHLKEAAVATMNIGLEALLTCAILAFFGSFLRSYLNVALYFVLQVAISMIIAAINTIRIDIGGTLGVLARFVDRHPEIARFVSTVGENLYPDRPNGFDRAFVMLILSNAAVALLFACLCFRRREVPYGAD